VESEYGGKHLLKWAEVRTNERGMSYAEALRARLEHPGTFLGAERCK
jgi:hypothetical protein